jgi:hypothetical protein
MHKQTAIVLVLLALTASPLLAATVSIPDDMVGVLGDVVTAPISVDDATGYLSCQFKITYSTDLLDLSDADVRLGEVISGWTQGTPNIDDARGIAIFSAYGDTPLEEGSGSLFELDFHVVVGTPGTSPLTFLVAWLDDDYPTRDGGSIVTAARPGDANYDGWVDDADASILGAHWRMLDGATWGDGDFNGDHQVTDADAAILAAHWHEGTPPPEGSVPEPATTALLAAGLMSLLAGRFGSVRRKRAAG